MGTSAGIGAERHASGAVVSSSPVRGGRREEGITIEQAAEHNLRDLDLTLGPGLVALVGVSGSGKSSLAFDTVYQEARRRFLQSLSLGTLLSGLQPARVRAIRGLSPAIAIAQDRVNRNPNSSVATAVGLHPFLRLLYARFAERRCSNCGELASVVAGEERLAFTAGLLAAQAAEVEVLAPLVQQVRGSHRHLLSLIAPATNHDDVEVDGRAWDGGPLDPERPHDITIRSGRLSPTATAAHIRDLLAEVDATGVPTLVLRLPDGLEHRLSRGQVCGRCGAKLQVLEPRDFHQAVVPSGGYTLGGLPLARLLAMPVGGARPFLAGLRLGPGAGRLMDEIDRRMAALEALGLSYVQLDRPSPSLSRGEAQRVQLAVMMANRVHDLLHVLDEPSIGLDGEQVATLMDRLAELKGPVLMVEHDPVAVAPADEVVELGPGSGPAGGRLVFQGVPAALWRAGTPSGRLFSGREPAPRRPLNALHGGSEIVVQEASLRNLAGFDCAFPVGGLTVVAGPSGAGKTTLARDVLTASLEAGRPVGCRGLEGPALRPVVVDQSPIGRNARSNPATYSGLAGRMRTLFARGSQEPGSAFSFNRPEGFCPACHGLGAIEVRLPHLPSDWVTCKACEGRRFRPETLAAMVRLHEEGPELSVADVLDLTVEEAAAQLDVDRRAGEILGALVDLGLGYLTLGQPSPSLSGGEAQRLKLARHLARARPGDLVLLDEPTSGLHPVELSRLLAVIGRLTGRGCTVIAVEHHPVVIAAADRVIRLGPGGGPDGGRLLSAGPPTPDGELQPRPRSRRRQRPPMPASIHVERASAHNLRNVTLDLPKGRLVALVGLSGSGKSSLLRDVVEAEATRRLLECLSMYERQSVREGPEAPVVAVDGLGPTMVLGPDRRLMEPRSTVGVATEVGYHVDTLLAQIGEAACPSCGGRQVRRSPAPGAAWACTACDREGPPIEPRHLSPGTYEAACLHCGGMGTIPEPRPERLIVRPDAPLCEGAMFSPGFFPTGYLCKPGSGGHAIMNALAARYGFDPRATPWREMPDPARRAFLFGDPEPLQIEMRTAVRTTRRTADWKGFFGIVAGWDRGGLYVAHVTCPACGGRRLRPEYLRVRLAGLDRHDLHTAPLVQVEQVLAGLASAAVPAPASPPVVAAVETARLRLGFLRRVSLGYLTLDRLTSTLSAGEAQRVKLAALLGGRLGGMTVIMDEPSRGLHPSEVRELAAALGALRDEGNTVLVAEHDREIVKAADHVVAMGPGAGRDGGAVVARGTPDQAAAGCPELLAPLLRDGGGLLPSRHRRPVSWLTVRGPAENNLTGADIRVPLGVLAGVCGVSGSGKSTLAVDTLGHALAPPRLTTSVAYERVDPGAHAGIEGAPPRTVVVDQARGGIVSAASFLGIGQALRQLYASSDAAAGAGLTDRDFARGCDACAGRGVVREEMGFLPAAGRPCEACDGTGARAEVRGIHVRGRTLPETEALTLDEVAAAWGDVPGVGGAIERATALGLGYLVLRQPGWSLSGGEAQRLKLVRELSRRTSGRTLYILDEPTVGQHPNDLVRLAGTLDQLVEAGHSVLVVEHHPGLLASCDWLLELGPGAGPEGGRVVAEGPPEQLAAGSTATAPYLREALGWL